MNTEQLSPDTDALHKSLQGDWERCYAAMHVHATKLEVLFRASENVRESFEGEICRLREQVAREKTLTDSLIQRLKASTE